MKADELRALQAPLKTKYKDNPASALYTLRAQGALGENLTCTVKAHTGPVTAGLHPGTGGTGKEACSADMLLESLVACSAVTLSAVATAMEIPLRGGTVTAEGDLDFRGTLGVAKDADIGFKEIRLNFKVDTDATPEQIETLLKLTKRYCVIYQTLVKAPTINTTLSKP